MGRFHLGFIHHPVDSHLVLLHMGYSTGVVSGGDVEMRPETQVIKHCGPWPCTQPSS